MMTTKIFLYHQRHRVILLDTSGAFFDRRYEQVYTKNLKAHRGTDNRILIEFVNQDQKPVDITGMQMLCRLMTAEDLIIEKELLIVNVLKGQTNLILTEQELDSIQPSTIGFSIEQVATFNEPVYVDDHAGGRGNIEILDSILPKFNSSEILTIPEGQLNTDYNTSIINTEEVQLHTFQIDLSTFTGTIAVQGATDIDGNWYEILSQPYVADDTITGFNVIGFHPYIRLSITDNTEGSITEILYR